MLEKVSVKSVNNTPIRKPPRDEPRNANVHLAAYESLVEKLLAVVNNLSTFIYDNYTLDNLTSGLVAAKKCPRNRLVFVGIPSDEDILAVAG